MHERSKRGVENVSHGWCAILLILLILVIDQTIKILVKSNMCLGEQHWITSWFCIDFVENNGMAYGMTFVNKLILSIFRIIAVGFIGWCIYRIIRREHRLGFVLCLAAILAGAAGNIFDSMFYGLIFSASTPFNVAEFVPFGTGYSSFLYGRVVDMFYFPLIVTTLPEWLPIWGGQEYIFFSPVFNFADSCITVGVFLLLIFYRKDLDAVLTSKKQEEAAEKEDDNIE